MRMLALVIAALACPPVCALTVNSQPRRVVDVATVKLRVEVSSDAAFVSLADAEDPADLPIRTWSIASTSVCSLTAGSYLCKLPLFARDGGEGRNYDQYQVRAANTAGATPWVPEAEVTCVGAGPPTGGCPCDIIAIDDLGILCPDRTLVGGAHVYSTVYGDPSALTEPQAVATHTTGDSAEVGLFFGTINFGNGVTITSGGGYDGYVVKRNAAGVAQWARKLGGSGSDYFFAVTFDNLGNVVVGGQFQGTADLGCGAHVNPPGNQFNGIISKHAGLTGACVWTRSFGSAEGGETVNGLTSDLSGNVYATGGFYGTNVDFGGGFLLSSHFSLAFNPDVYILKLSSAGVTTWARGGFGASANDLGRSVAVDASGNVYTTGSFELSIDFGAPTSPMPCNGFPDVFLVKHSSSGIPIWSKQYGDSSTAQGSDVAVMGSVVYLTGSFQGGIAFGTPEMLRVASPASAVFLAKMDISAVPVWSMAYADGSEGSRLPSVAATLTGEAVLANYVKTNRDFGSGTLYTTNETLRDWMIAKFSPDGGGLWSYRFTGAVPTAGTESRAQGVAVSGTSTISTGWINGDVDFGGGVLNNGTGLTHAGVALKVGP